MSPTPLHDIVDDARRVINRGVNARVACAALAGAGALALIVGLLYTATGHRVPLWVYAVATAAAAAGFGLGWCLRRVNHHTAAHRIDQAFGLADGVSAARAFEASEHEGGYYHLQKQWAQSAVSAVKVATLRPRTPRWLAAAAVALPVTAVLLGFRPPAPEVLAAEAAAAHTLAFGAELNQGLKDEIQKHLDEATQEEREALEPESLTELAEKLELSEERADLMRQYAAMEQNLAERSAALQQKRAEQMLDDAAAKMAAAPSTSALALALQQKQYEKAAELLKQMQPDAKASPETQRQQLEKLKAAASQLGQAAKRFRAGRGASGSSGRTDDLADQLATLSEQLDQDTQELDQALKKATAEKKSGPLSEATKKKLSQCQGQCNSTGNGLQKKLSQLGGQRKARFRINLLRKTVSQCQGSCAGQCPSPFAKNGIKPGSASVDSPNNQLTPEGGNPDAITGQKGRGPSQTTVEEAASGTGVSGRQASGASPAQYSRQLESFVDRPDVPEEVKEGVKNYFQSLHQTPDQALSADETSSP